VSTNKKVRKAVLPVAGLGTRFLPATKAQPKEMLPVVDKPLIQYAVEEAVASGIEDIILVTSHGKGSIEEHFNADHDLVSLLESRGKQDEAALVRRTGELANVFSVGRKSRWDWATRSVARAMRWATSPSWSSCPTT